jgi:LytS/YehU family sensor histidine kinase
LSSQQFIFSNEKKYILARHISFWISFAIVCFITGIFPYKPKDLLNSGVYIISLEWVICFIPVSILFTYLFLHLVLPFFNKKRINVTLSLAIGAASLMNILIACLLTKVFLPNYTPGNNQQMSGDLQLTYFHSIVFTMLLTGVIMAVIVIKNWYNQVNENTDLFRHKIYNERNILKSQVYPTFLFSSLTTLYKQIDKSCNEAAALLLRLSDILSYILYDSGEELVLLSKELINIGNYIEIVKKEKGDTVVLKDHVPEYLREKYVPPLLMFSMLESIVSEMNDYSAEGIEISISVKDNFLEFIVICQYESAVIPRLQSDKIIKAIEARLKAFKIITDGLVIVKNEDSFIFLTRIMTRDSLQLPVDGFDIRK